MNINSNSIFHYLLVGYVAFYCVFAVFVFVAYWRLVPEEAKKLDLSSNTHHWRATSMVHHFKPWVSSAAINQKISASRTKCMSHGRSRPFVSTMHFPQNHPSSVVSTTPRHPDGMP